MDTRCKKYKAKYSSFASTSKHPKENRREKVRLPSLIETTYDLVEEIDQHKGEMIKFGFKHSLK